MIFYSGDAQLSFTFFFQLLNFVVFLAYAAMSLTDTKERVTLYDSWMKTNQKKLGVIDPYLKEKSSYDFNSTL